MENLNMGRVVSSIVAVVYGWLIVRGTMPPEAFAMALFGMLFIWFPSLARFFDQLKPGFTKTTASLDPNTPSCVYVAIGWGLMLLPWLYLAGSALA